MDTQFFTTIDNIKKAIKQATNVDVLNSDFALDNIRSEDYSSICISHVSTTKTTNYTTTDHTITKEDKYVTEFFFDVNIASKTDAMADMLMKKVAEAVKEADPTSTISGIRLGSNRTSQPNIMCIVATITYRLTYPYDCHEC